jgi:alcohol dehydrogenase (cytochrome c)
MRTLNRFVATVSVTAVVAFLASTALAADVTKSRLENADGDPDNWLTTFQNYSSHRYSRLAQINQNNVHNLKVAFSVPLSVGLDGLNSTTANIQGPPLVDDGMMFIQTSFGITYKIDVNRGNRGIVLWRADPNVVKENESFFANRGVALWGDQVYSNLIDGRVLAMSRATGEITWDKQIARTKLGYTNLPGGPDAQHFVIGEKFTAAPLAVEGKILVGQSAGDWGTRGWLAAIDAANGNELWRTYTIPGPGEPGHDTWKDNHNAWRTGGASLWTTGSYDPQARITVWGTSNPVPMFDVAFRPGDNLWTNSALAFDIDTGKIKWGFQYTPNESWDFDENGVHMLFDTVINGQPRKVVGHYGRNGFYYQLDRNDGTFINGTQYVYDLNWTAGLDPKTGKPLEYDPTRAIQTYIPATRNERGKASVLYCPHLAGGLRWQPPAYNPDHRVIYAAGHEGCSAASVDATAALGPAGGNPKGAGKVWSAGPFGTVIAGTYEAGSITAMDVTTNRMVAKIRLPFPNLAGVLATAGGLIFTGNQDGGVVAYNDRTLSPLWTFFTGNAFKAPPIAYAVNGKQYIAIIAGGNGVGANPERGIMDRDAQLWVFAL